MAQRFTAAFVLSIAALAPQVGCQSLPSRGEFAALGGMPAADAQQPAADKVQLPPDRAALLCLTTAQMLERSDHVAEAITQYEKARQLDPRLTNQTARRLAVLYDRQGAFSKAAPEYQRALHASPRDPDLLNDIGYCYFQQSNWTEAEKSLREAVRIDPKHQRAWINLGMTLGQEQRYQESYQAFTHAVSPAEAQCNLAFVYSTQGKHDEARQAYAAALRIRPDLMLARAALAKLSTTQSQTTVGPAAPGTDIEAKAAAAVRLAGFMQQRLETPPEPNRDSLPATAGVSLATAEVMRSTSVQSDSIPGAAEPPPAQKAVPLTNPISIGKPPADSEGQKPNGQSPKPIARAVPKASNASSPENTSQPASVSFD